MYTGRLPIRVELKGLVEADLLRILTEPQFNLIRQQAHRTRMRAHTCTRARNARKALARKALARTHVTHSHART